MGNNELGKVFNMANRSNLFFHSIGQSLQLPQRHDKCHVTNGLWQTLRAQHFYQIESHKNK